MRMRVVNATGFQHQFRGHPRERLIEEERRADSSSASECELVIIRCAYDAIEEAWVVLSGAKTMTTSLS